MPLVTAPIGLMRSWQRREHSSSATRRSIGTVVLVGSVTRLRLMHPAPACDRLAFLRYYGAAGGFWTLPGAQGYGDRHSRAVGGCLRLANGRISVRDFG